MGLGSLVPHRVKGTSGGAKIAFPGVSGPELQYRNQWEASMRMSETVMGVAENSMRLRMEEAARLVGLDTIANVVLDREGRVAGCFVGDVVAAHREGSRRAVEIYGLDLPERADVVVVDAHPADRDLWQSAKALYSGALAVKPGGALIAVAPNPEGVARNHENLLEIGYRPHAEIVALAHSGEVEDLVGLAILADIAQIVDHAECYLVSPGVKAEEAEKLGLRPARDLRSALDEALASRDASASVAVIRHGGHALPVVRSGSLRGTGPGDLGHLVTA